MKWTTHLYCRRRFHKTCYFGRIVVTFVIGNRLLPSSDSLSIVWWWVECHFSQVWQFWQMCHISQMCNFTHMSLICWLLEVCLSKRDFESAFLFWTVRKHFFGKCVFQNVALFHKMYNVFHKCATFHHWARFYNCASFAKHARFCEGKHSF